MLITYFSFKHFIKVFNMISTRFPQIFPQNLGGATNYGFTKGFSQERFYYQLRCIIDAKY